MKTSARGRCLCGTVQFEVQFPTEFCAHCHCRSCRLSHGAAFVTWTGVHRDRFLWHAGEDAVRWYRSAGGVLWGFCGECGSSMLYQADREGHPEAPKLDRMYVCVASLEEPLDRAAAAHVSYEEHVAFFEGLEALPRYRGKGIERMD